MHDLTQPVGFLESLNLAYGYIRPEDILLDRNRLQFADFDCCAETGSDVEVILEPHGRGSRSPKRGSLGLLGPRSEPFALGSIYYFINYGHKVYDDQCFGGGPSGKRMLNS